LSLVLSASCIAFQVRVSCILDSKCLVFPCHVLVPVLVWYLEECVELSCVLSLSWMTLHFPSTCVSCFTFLVCVSILLTPRPSPRITLSGLLFLLTSDGRSTSPSHFRHFLPSPSPSVTPPPSTPEPGSLHLEVSLLMMMSFFWEGVRGCLLWRDKPISTENTYMWVSV
jgi:hypothetical protein